MVGNATAAEKLCNVICKVIAVVLEKVVGLRTVYWFERIEVFEENLIRERSYTEMNLLHRVSVMGSPGNGKLNSLACMGFSGCLIEIIGWRLAHHNSTHGPQGLCWCGKWHLQNGDN